MDNIVINWLIAYLLIITYSSFKKNIQIIIIDIISILIQPFRLINQIINQIKNRK